MKELRSALSAFFRAAGESACAHGKPHFIAACRLYVVPRSRALRPISCYKMPDSNARASVEIRAQGDFALQNARVRRHRVRHPDVTPDHRVVPHRDAPQHTRVAVDHHAVFYDRVAGQIQQSAVVGGFEAARAERHSLVELRGR